MGFYDKYILPKFLDVACGAGPIEKQRQKVVPEAAGRVLEIGIGSGLNLPFYDGSKIEHLWGLEPAEEMRALAKPKADAAPFDVEFLGLKGEEIPLDDNSVDMIVMTYTLCTIPDTQLALEQMRRVLKPGGRMVYSEHGKAPDANVQKWQDRINPFWNKIAGGCNVNRNIAGLMSDAGFQSDDMQTMYLPNTPKFAGFNYWGSAVAR